MVRKPLVLDSKLFSCFYLFRVICYLYFVKPIGLVPNCNAVFNSNSSWMSGRTYLLKVFSSLSLSLSYKLLYRWISRSLDSTMSKVFTLYSPASLSRLSLHLFSLSLSLKNKGEHQELITPVRSPSRHCQPLPAREIKN